MTETATAMTTKSTAQLGGDTRPDDGFVSHQWVVPPGTCAAQTPSDPPPDDVAPILARERQNRVARYQHWVKTSSGRWWHAIPWYTPGQRIPTACGRTVRATEMLPDERRPMNAWRCPDCDAELGL